MSSLNWHVYVLFRYGGRADHVGMASLREKIDAERTIRDLLREHGMPEPERVEYGYTCIRVFFDEPKVCVVIDIDEAPEGFEKVGMDLAGAARELTDGDEDDYEEEDDLW
jgi:hypothetical protein